MTKKKSTPKQEGREDYEDDPYTITNKHPAGKGREEYNAGWSEAEMDEARGKSERPSIASFFKRKPGGKLTK